MAELADFVNIKKLDPFDPTKDNPYKFWTKFTMIADRLNWKEPARRKDGFWFFLNEEAQLWYSLVVEKNEKITTDEDLKEAFLNTFGMTSAIAFRALSERHQMEDETPDSYISDKIWLCEAYNKGMTEYEKIDYIIANLLPAYKDKMALSPTPETLHELYEKFSRVEKVLGKGWASRDPSNYTEMKEKPKPRRHEGRQSGVQN